MKFLVNENIPRMTVDALRELGRDVKDVRGTSDQGLPDADLWALATAESRAHHNGKRLHRVSRGTASWHTDRAPPAAQPAEDSPRCDARARPIPGPGMAEPARR